MGKERDKKMYRKVYLVKMRILIIVSSVIVGGIILLNFLFTKELPEIGDFRLATTEKQFVFIKEYKAFGGVMLAYNREMWKKHPWPKKIHVTIVSTDGQTLLDDTIDLYADRGILGETVPGHKKLCETNWVRTLHSFDDSCLEGQSIRSFYMPTRDYGECLVSVETLSSEPDVRLYWAPYFENSW
ncbi:MAG: hypothetical protein IKW49_08165 [Opitutales bacterium]|nr:hypothetical protein [Opitutales bacterium]